MPDRAPKHDRRSSAINASVRSRYRLADKAVWRVGYGAMQLAGEGAFGPQNFFNLAARHNRPLLDECSAREIAFVPFCPLGYPRAQREAILSNPVVNSVAAARDASAAQVALAWLLSLAPNVLLIPGTRTRAHLAENLAAGGLWLGVREIALLNQEFS